jgi:CHAD domain-containing protein
MKELFRLPFPRQGCIFISRFNSVASFMPIALKRSSTVFQKLERDLLKLCAKPRSENVHGFRTGTRRVQVLLGELSPGLNRGQKKLLKLLDRIRKRAGRVRDIDAQLSALRSLKIAGDPRRKTQLVNHLIELRVRQENKLRKAVDDETVREIRKRLKRARKDFNPATSRDPLAVARRTLEPIRLEHEIFAEALLHRYRILSKRARYAAEFAEPSPEARELIACIKPIQDALGDWHDWFILSRAAGEAVGDVRESALAAELHNVTGAKFRHAVAVLEQMRAKPVPNSKHPVPAPALTPAKAGRAASAA